MRMDTLGLTLKTVYTLPEMYENQVAVLYHSILDQCTPRDTHSLTTFIILLALKTAHELCWSPGPYGSGTKNSNSSLLNFAILKIEDCRFSV